jgi:antitoxin MazE
MKIERWGESIVIPVSQRELAERGLSVGDEVDLTVKQDAGQSHSGAKRAMIDRMRELARPLPPDYRFNRIEANGFEEE